jgi:hypothetical protein
VQKWAGLTWKSKELGQISYLHGLDIQGMENSD